MTHGLVSDMSLHGWRGIAVWYYQNLHALLHALGMRFASTLGKFHDTWSCAQALGREQEWISELIFWTMFISFALWSFSPFVVERKRFYTVVLYGRLLMVLVGGSCSHVP